MSEPLDAGSAEPGNSRPWPSAPPGWRETLPLLERWRIRRLLFRTELMEELDESYDTLACTVVIRHDRTHATGSIRQSVVSLATGVLFLWLYRLSPQHAHRTIELALPGAFLCGLGIWILHGGLRDYLRRRTVTIGGTAVSVQERTLFGRFQWEEPITGFTGLRAGLETLSRPRTWTDLTGYYRVIELAHEDEMRCLRLFKARASHESRARRDRVLRHLSQLLDTPIIQEDRSRDIEDPA